MDLRSCQRPWTTRSKLWNAHTGEELHTLRGHSGRVYACALSADGRTVLSASLDHTLKLWDARSGDEPRTLRGHSDTLYGCALSADGRTVLSASLDNTLKVWSPATGQCLSSVYGAAAFLGVATAPGIVVAGDALGNVWMLDLALNALHAGADTPR